MDDVSAHAQIALAREAALARLLLGAARVLGETLVPERVYERFHDILTDAVQHDGVVVSAFEPSDGSIRCEYAWSDGVTLDVSAFPVLRLNPEGGMQSEVIRTGKPLLLNDVQERVHGPGTYYDVDASGTLRKLPDEGESRSKSAMMVPVKHEGTVVGVVQVQSDEGPYSADDLELVEGLVAQMGAAVRNARLHEERARAEAREAAAHAAAAERAQAAHVLEAVGDGIALVDDDGFVRFWNRAAEVLTGIPSVRARDRPAADVVRDWETIASGVAVTQGYATPRATTLPVEMRGREAWLSFVAVRGGGGVVYAFRDVTREHELETAKSDFIATVSHELRTPMAAVFGAAQTLLREDVQLSDEQHRELVQMIASQAARLAHVTEEVLIANTLDRGDLYVEATSVDVDAVVRETVQAQLPSAELELHGGVAVGDRDRVQQVLVNLLDNASKYGGHRVLVKTEAHETSIRVAVTDDGIGLAPGDRARVFEKFFRADPQLTRSPAGTGLGLYICKELVERMHGRIGATSPPGGGSTFWFELPARRP